MAGQAVMRKRFASMTIEERRAYCDHVPINTPENRRLNSLSKMGEKNPMKRPEVAAKVSATIKRRWGTFFSEQMKNTWKSGKLGPWQRGETLVAPNKAEMVLGSILEDYLPSFQFVGNGAYWVGPCLSGKRRNPDFLDKNAKKVILLHGEFWHSRKTNRVEVKDYLGIGLTPLVIWCKDLRMMDRKKLIKKICLFGADCAEKSLSANPSSII